MDFFSCMVFFCGDFSEFSCRLSSSWKGLYLVVVLLPLSALRPLTIYCVLTLTQPPRNSMFYFACIEWMISYIIIIGLLEHHLISSIFSQCFISDYRLITLLFYTNLLQRSGNSFFHGCFQPKRSLKPNLHPWNPPPPLKTPWGSRSFQPPRRMGRSRWPRLRARLHQRRSQRPGAGHRQRGQQRWILAPLTLQRDHRAKLLGHHRSQGKDL